MTTDPANFQKVSRPGPAAFGPLRDALPVANSPSPHPWPAARPSRIQPGREYPPPPASGQAAAGGGDAGRRLTQGADDYKLPRKREVREETVVSRVEWAVQSLGASHPVAMLAVDWLVAGALAITAYHLAFLTIIAHLTGYTAEKRSLLVVTALTATAAAFQILINHLRENNLPRMHLRVVCLVIVAVGLLDAGQVAATIRVVFAGNPSTTRWLVRFAYLFAAVGLFWGSLMYRQASRLSLRYDPNRIHVAAYHKLARQLRNALLK